MYTYELLMIMITCIRPAKIQVRQNPRVGEMELDMKSHSCLRSFDIWLLLEEEELAFFNSVAPGISITLQGRPQAQER